MPNKTSQSPSDYIIPLNMNGLQGRMLRMPAPTKRNREILLVYGHHAVLERWWGLVQNINEYGAVTMPDLPGFGGMDSFLKIGKKPTLDNYADYLASFIKLRYKNRHVTIIGISFGFVVVTRMLQRYPELSKKVDFVVSIVGFIHKDDFIFKQSARRFYVFLARLFATRPISYLIRHVFLNAFVIKNLYRRLSRGKKRFAEADVAEFENFIDFDVYLWQTNDVRTHWLTTYQFLLLDNCKVHVDVPVWHVYAPNDYYFNNSVVEQHMRITFSEYHPVEAKEIVNHTPSILANKKEMSVLVPPGLRRVLSRKV
ncbi:MAG TPA: alpha/beta hydrolase [Candidatus Saccharimonadales bacterium]|nr:alpha/beta hydrolase [Candidatus Saccharimonadales bacterium]